MAQLNQAFDSSRHDDMNNFDPIPTGAYPCWVTKSDIKQTKDKTGKYIEFEFTVIKGEFKGRKIWTRMNIINKSAVTVEIAQKELATLCRACGKSVIQDTQQLHGIPFILKVRIKPEKGDYPASNVPAGYAMIEGSASGPAPSFAGDAFSEHQDQEDDAPWGGDEVDQPDEADQPDDLDYLSKQQDEINDDTPFEADGTGGKIDFDDDIPF